MGWWLFDSSTNSSSRCFLAGLAGAVVWVEGRRDIGPSPRGHQGDRLELRAPDDDRNIIPLPVQPTGSDAEESSEA
jgi:hypothetical protein